MTARRIAFSSVPSVPTSAESRAVLAAFVASRGKTAERAIKARYDFSLVSDQMHRYDGRRTFRFAISPKDGTETYSRWIAGYRRPRLEDNELAFVYRAPPDSISAVPSIDGMVYRGMSWEEWQSIRKRCLIQSKGEWNLGQPGLTFFGDADTAQHYATGFTPWMFRPSKRRPGIVIAIQRKYVLDHRDSSLVPQGEFAVRGTLSAAMIKGVWRLVPTLIEGGYQEVSILHWPKGKIEEGQGTGVGVYDVAVVPSSLRELTRCAAQENPARRRGRR